MAWFWLASLVLILVLLRLYQRRRRQYDAYLQDAVEHFSPQAEVEEKIPPVQQPWWRPGFGPAPRQEALEFGSSPFPPPAGPPENPDVAGPLPDDDDLLALPAEPAAQPVEPAGSDGAAAESSAGAAESGAGAAESGAGAAPPPPPPPGAAATWSPADVPPVDVPPADAAPADTGDIPPPPGAATAEDIPPPPGAATEPDDEDGLFGTLRKPQAIELPPELADEARQLMRSKQEVAAVRLICDSTGATLLDAQRTARSLVGR